MTASSITIDLPVGPVANRRGRGSDPALDYCEGTGIACPSVSTRSGVHSEIEHVVTEADTAAAMHSGDVPVLSTPRIVGLCEEASMDALAGLLTPEQTSVGSRVEIAHLAPVAVG